MAVGVEVGVVVGVEVGVEVGTAVGVNVGAAVGGMGPRTRHIFHPERVLLPSEVHLSSAPFITLIPLLGPEDPDQQLSPMQR